MPLTAACRIGRANDIDPFARLVAVHGDARAIGTFRRDLEARGSRMSAIVGSGSRTSIDTLCSPRIASSLPIPAPIHGERASVRAETRSKCSPDESANAIASSSNRWTRETMTPRARRRCSQKSSDSAGTENAVPVTWPAPLTPTRTPRP